MPGSFRVVGNDGMHYNQGIDEGTNFSVPANIRSALYAISDHLPVLVELEVQRLGIGLDETAAAQRYWQQTRDANGVTSLYWRGPLPTQVDAYDAYGRWVHTQRVEQNNQPLERPSAASGLIFLRAGNGSSSATYTWAP